jgi:hypothetical protein
VESWGEKTVRERRRGVVRSVELEAARIETIWAETWRRFVEKSEEEEVDAVLVAGPSVDSASADEESDAMTVDTSSTPASVDPLSSAIEPVASDGTAEDTASPSPTEQTSTVPLPTESAVIEEAADIQPALSSDLTSQLTPTLDNTEDMGSENGESETSPSSDSDMVSGDSDYESVGSVISEQDQNDRSDNDEVEVDFVML